MEKIHDLWVLFLRFIVLRPHSSEMDGTTSKVIKVSSSVFDVYL